ncbi:MAG: PAS domain-containing protein [Alphaproteobacteria bacterium]|nr:PAS domain-containing protein [Alphaproteobacteria bacterium]
MVFPGSAPDGSGQPRFRQVRLAILGITAVVLCALFAFVGFGAWRDHRDAMDEATRTSQNLARTLEEHAAGVFRRADLLLSSLAQAVQTAGGIDSPSVRALVASYDGFLHAEERLVLVDVDGVVAVDPRDPDAHANVADWEDFRLHRERADGALHVSAALVSVPGPGLSVGLSRRLSSADGRFAGVVIYAVRASYFRELYSSLAIGSAGTVTLWDSNSARVLARFPSDERAMGRSFEAGPLFQRIRAGQVVGTFTAPSPLDRIDRLLSYRKLADAPFAVSIGLADVDYLRRWRDGLQGDLIAVAAVTITIIAMAWLLLHQLRRSAASEARLAAVVANVPGAIYQRRVDADGRLSYPWVSAGISEIHGFTAEEAMRDSRLLFDAIHPGDWKAYEPLLADSAANQTPLAWEGRIIRQDGGIRWVQVMSRPRRLPGGGMEWDGVIVDITERKRMEAALHAAREAADAANRSKTQFLANMSHELRTPLNAILGFSEILQAEYFGPLNVKQREYVGDIHRSGVHLLQVISNILDISKIEAGKDELIEETVHLTPLVQAQLALVMPQAQNGQIKLVAEIPPMLPPLRADPVKVKQMLLNLLSNAIKFTPPGGTVTVAARLEGSADARGGMSLTVSDTGIGMSPDDIPAALEPFRRLDNGRMLRSLGTGLGLAITKAQIELHGGRLDITSAAGVGTRATLYFPPERVLPEHALARSLDEIRSRHD